MSETVSKIGRPKSELSARRRNELRRRVATVERLERELEEARAALVASLEAARGEGASFRVIEEEVPGLTRASVHRWLAGEEEAS